MTQAVDLYEHTKVKFIDCYLASSVRIQSGVAATLSYDRDFDKIGVPRLEPSQLLRKIKT